MMIYLMVYGILLLVSAGLINFCVAVMSCDDMPITLAARPATSYVPKIDLYREMAFL